MTSVLQFDYGADNGFVLLLTGLEHTSLIHFAPYNAVGMFGACNYCINIVAKRALVIGHLIWRMWTSRPIFPLLLLGDFKWFFPHWKRVLVTSMEFVYHPKETTVYMVYVWFNMHKTVDFALPFVMARYLSNTSLFVVSLILIDNAKSERNLYIILYTGGKKKSYICTDPNFLCLP
jgi:hypothetical protein